MTASPGEIVTVGLGNYGTLVASHWCNSTTKYDREHSVLYSQEGRRGPVPRLALFDAHHPTAIVEEKLTMDGAQYPSNQVADPAMLQRLGFPNWGAEEDEDKSDDAGSDDDGSEDEDQRRRAEADGGDGRQQQHVDPAQAGGQQAAKQESDEQIPIFNTKSQGVVPWWKYIAVPLHPRTLTMAGSDHVDPLGGGPSSSFGFGATEWRPNSTSAQAQPFVTLYDNVRHLLEECDSCQGVQIYVDANSAYGGFAHNFAVQLRDDIGRKPIVCHAAFEPPAALGEEEKGDGVNNMLKNRSKQLRDEQPVLNRLFSTHLLSNSVDVYTPFECDALAVGNNLGVENLDAVGRAALIAAATDTAMYCTRQDVSSEYRSLGMWSSTLRPNPSARIVGAFARGFGVKAPFDLRAVDKKFPSLWKTISESASLLNPEHFTPLSYSIRPDSYERDDGRVLGHAVTLRGFGHLVDDVYPREESLIRYIAPLRTERFLTNVTEELYPVSVSYPGNLLPDAKQRGFPLVTHFVNGNSVAEGMLKPLYKAAEPIVRYGRSLHKDRYPFEDDEWREALDDVATLRDGYDYADPESDGGDD